ncbi:molybdopterin molybdotransferase MoeA [Paenibacillus kobensis]|uniref:molybdopterin molybdotransferase MoeA n=1 Tax=Paenibacillus kobensis TaxID=59841 RepID=UPI000FDB3C07|nr:gephyrin-like molybdotransferase Glp [Paenibacillus kobensis]
MGANGTELQDKLGSRFRRRSVKVAEAQSRIMETVEAWMERKARMDMVPLHRSGGRRAARRMHATCDWPPFDRSGVDGFAVRAEEVAGAAPDCPAVLRIAGTVAAGDAPEALMPGTAMRIMTGAMIPEQADAVVMLEQTVDAEAGAASGIEFSRRAGSADDGYVRIKQPAQTGQHIAPRGEELQKGAPLIERGELIRPGHVALLGTFGYTEVPVCARPRIAIFATGSELLPVGQPLRPGQIRDSNSAMLAAMVEQSGGEAEMYGSLPDELPAVREALREAWDTADIIVTTGGVSVGDYDVMAELMRSVLRRDTARGLRESGGDEELHRIDAADGEDELLFNRVSMRPGSPTSAARIGGKLLFALSGNPGACFVGFELFVRPALLALQGESKPLPRVVQARLASGFDKGSPHDRYVRVSLRDSQGYRIAEPLGFAKSSMMVSIPAADGLALIPSGSAGAAAGETVDILLIP